MVVRPMLPSPSTVFGITLDGFAVVVTLMIAYQIVAAAIEVRRFEREAVASIRAGKCPGCGGSIDSTQSQCPVPVCRYWINPPP